MRVFPSGRKSYVVEYRPGAGGRNAPKRRYTIGQHGSPWTPETARKKAIEILADVIRGADPSAERQEARKLDQENVRHFVELFIERYAKKKQRSWKETERVLAREFLPQLGKKRLNDVSKRDIVLVVDRIADRAPVMANRAFSYIRRFFNWCVEQSLLEVSPCAGLKPPAGGQQRERILSDEELVEVWNAAGTVTPIWNSVFKLLILTAQRKNEVVGMEWEEIDWNQMLWKIPGRRTKNGRSHEVPITSTMSKILSEIPRIEGCKYVFSSNGQRPVASQSRIKNAIDEEIERLRQERAPLGEGAKSMPHWTIHDLRRTATTGMARLGIPPHVADALLNHKGGVVSGVAAVYNRYGYLEERRHALQEWESHVLGLLDQKH